MNLKQNGPESWMTWSEFCKGVRDTGKPQWISVKDRLPSKKRGVLVTDGDNICTARIVPLQSGISLEAFSTAPIEWTSYGFDGPEWDFDFIMDEVTHWMPLPDLPKKEVKNA